jgi:hypothetical protein
VPAEWRQSPGELERVGATYDGGGDVAETSATSAGPFVSARGDWVNESGLRRRRSGRSAAAGGQDEIAGGLVIVVVGEPPSTSSSKLTLLTVSPTSPVSH